MNLTEAAKTLHERRKALKAHLKQSKEVESEIRSDIRKCEDVMLKSSSGIDHEKVELAKTIVFATDYASGGRDRKSCVDDAIRQLATGEPIRPAYGDLFKVFFGTKNYAEWIGQRDDCSYGCGPRHGHTCFKVGLTKSARDRGYEDFTPEEIEAAIYYLNNLERIQEAESAAKSKAEAA